MWNWKFLVKISNFIVLGGYGYPKWPPLGQNFFFLAQKKFSKFFSESSSQNMMFDTKTNFLSFVDPKLWPFKSLGYQKIAKFWKAHNTPPRGPRAEKFWFSKFLPRGYLHAKNDQNRWDKGVQPPRFLFLSSPFSSRNFYHPIYCWLDSFTVLLH